MKKKEAFYKGIGSHGIQEKEFDLALKQLERN